MLYNVTTNPKRDSLSIFNSLYVPSFSHHLREQATHLSPVVNKNNMTLADIRQKHLKILFIFD